jgi:Mur ligase middle domain
MVLQNPRVDFAVFEVARGGILREGLGYERNDVGVVRNVQADHLGLRGVDTLEQLADVKAVIVEAVPRKLASPCSMLTIRWSGRCDDVVSDGLFGSAWPSQAARSAIPLMITAVAVAEQSY